MRERCVSLLVTDILSRLSVPEGQTKDVIRRARRARLRSRSFPLARTNLTPGAGFYANGEKVSALAERHLSSACAETLERRQGLSRISTRPL